MLDRLLFLQKVSVYPFNRTDAVVPQTLIPDELRLDKKRLANFYFFACIYMRGGITSSTAFKLLLEILHENPWMFEPREVVKRTVEEATQILKDKIGWDSKNAGQFWHKNAQLLVDNWSGEHLNVIIATKNYDDALRFYVNKNKKDKPFKGSDQREQGFWGHQHKMASMQVYFADWDGLYLARFNYPGPVDFHNYRFFISNGSVIVFSNTESVSFGEKYSKPIREVLMEYILSRKVDPLELADAIWLYSLLMCGESPYTVTKEMVYDHKTEKMDVKRRKAPLFTHGGVEDEKWDMMKWASRKRRSLDRSCHVCAFNLECEFAIPAGPYYGKKEDVNERGGKIVLRKRPALEVYLKPKDAHKALASEPLEGDAKIYNAFAKVERPKAVLHA